MSSPDGSDLVVRPATTADARALGRLGALLVRTHHEFDRARFMSSGAGTEEGYASFLASQIGRDDVILLVGEERRAVIAYCYAGIEGRDYMSLRGPAGVLHDIIVDPEHRGRGVARRLLDATLREIEARGMSQVVLFAATRNEAARRLFVGAGFRDTMVEMTRDRARADASQVGRVGREGSRA